MAAVTPTLEFIFRIHMSIGCRDVFAPLPSGLRRGFSAAAGGTIEGPALNGRVLPNSGGDYPLFDDRGNTTFNAHYILEASDGTQIYMQNRGYRVASPEINKRLRANEVVDMSEYYFRVNPIFEVPAGPHDWLAHTVVVGSADRREDHTVFDYYAVR